MTNHPIIKAYIKTNKFGDLLGMNFEVDSLGKVIYEMTIDESHLATSIAAHGGSISSLMDATMGVCALASVIDTNRVVSTLEMKISFVAPAFKDDKLTGTATVLRKGKRILFVEGKITNQNNKLVAVASGTFNSYPAEKAGIRI